MVKQLKLKMYCFTFKQQLQNHVDGKVCCNRVNDVSATCFCTYNFSERITTLHTRLLKYTSYDVMSFIIDKHIWLTVTDPGSVSAHQIAQNANFFIMLLRVCVYILFMKCSFFTTHTAKENNKNKPIEDTRTDHRKHAHVHLRSCGDWIVPTWIKGQR